MNCEEFKEKMFLYPEVEGDFLTHLEECESCKNDFEYFLSIEKRLREDPLRDNIEKEWDEVYREVYSKLRFENIKRKIIILGLILSEVFLYFLVIFGGYKVLRLFLSDWSFLVLTLQGVFRILFSLNSYIFLFLLSLLLLHHDLNKKK